MVGGDPAAQLDRAAERLIAGTAANVDHHEVGRGTVDGESRGVIVEGVGGHGKNTIPVAVKRAADCIDDLATLITRLDPVSAAKVVLSALTVLMAVVTWLWLNKTPPETLPGLVTIEKGSANRAGPCWERPGWSR